MNRQQILSRLGKRGWRVAYSYGALDWWQRGSSRWKSSPLCNTAFKRDGIIDITSGRIGVRWRKYPLFDEFALARHARYMRSRVATHGERIIVMLFDPQFFPYVRHLEPCDVVFHVYDDFSGQPGWTVEKAKMQAQLLARAEMVSASSEAIANRLNHSGAVRVLENGADVAAFTGATNLSEPQDLIGIPHPRIGYIGTLNRKVDFPMIAQIARECPEWHWVLVGRVESRELEGDPELSGAFLSCKNFPNVHILGQKSRIEIPAYVGNMDINTMCYRHGGNGWWNAVSPLKLHEYFASGQPVISAPVPAVMRFSDYMEIARSPMDWKEKIAHMLSTASVGIEERVLVASKNSWENRVDVIEDWLGELVE